jgi:ABC-type multidrug transport system permease subunit
MNKLWLEIKKDFKILKRSKLASFIIVIAPLLLIFLIGFAFNAPEEYRLSLGVYSETYNDLTQGIVSSMEETSLNVIKINSREECLENIKLGTQNACVIFPNNMTIGVKDDFVEIFVDTSKSNIAWIVKDITKNKIESSSLDIRKNITNTLIGHINNVEEEAVRLNKEIDDAVKIITTVEKSHSTITKKITKINLETNTQSFKTEDTKGLSKNSEINVNNAVIKLNDLLKEIEDDLEDIYDDVLGLGNSTEHKNILKYINTSNKQMKTLGASVNSPLDEASGSLRTINKRLETLETNLNSLTTRMADSKKVKQSSLDGLKMVDEKINTSLSKFEEVKSSLGKLKDRMASVKIREPEELAQPIDIKVESVTPDQSNLSIVFPQFLSVIIVFISLIIPAIMRVHDKNSTGYVRQILSPVRDFVFVIGTYVTNLIIILFQFLVVVLISKFIIGLDLFQNFFTLLFSILIISSAFIMIGILIGQIFKEEHTATIAAVSILTLMLFFSGMIMPLESLSQAIFNFNNYNPFVMSISIIRGTIFFGIPLVEFGKLITLLILYWATAYLTTMLILELSQKRTFTFLKNYIKTKFKKIRK